MRSIPKVPGLMNKPEVKPVETKSPMYRGKSKGKREDTVERPPIPVSGKGGPPSHSNAGGRFGRGGWKNRPGLKFGKTADQEEESKRKQAQMSLKKKAVGKRLKTLKQGPNEKQSQLLGE